MYKDSLDDALDSNIDDIVANTIDTNPCPLKQRMSTTQPGTPFDVLLPSRLFNKVASGGDKNSSPSAKRSLSSTLPPSIVPKESSNPLLRPSGHYDKLRKRKPRAALTSLGLEDLGYIIDQSGSQGVFAMSKSNADNTESSWENRTQKGSSVIRE